MYQHNYVTGGVPAIEELTYVRAIRISPYAVVPELTVGSTREWTALGASLFEKTALGDEAGYNVQ